MIKVERLNKPQVLVQNAASWTRKLENAKTKLEIDKAESKYRHEEIKNTLKAMFHGKCAYCESQILHIDYGHIEHFRPKRNPKFRHLTFEWTNLLLACGVCNSRENKGTKFPEEAENGPLINPSDDNPAQHFDFIFDDITKIASIYGSTLRGELTERVLGLNRPELLRYRSKQVKILVYLALKASENDSRATALLQQACDESSEYAAFARMLKLRFCQRL
ncbi:MAG: TIGR02646 family protein [Spirosomaceae bacterium]|jgi:uncharacterized protein (TIGR02646 family)|nr:TIGR02646 family protein [Spirosomataceae bacterium]